MEKTLNSLTAIRGIAAFFVVLFHYHIMVSPLFTADTAWPVGKLYLMVDCFFVLSGFVMAHVYGHDFTRGIERSRYWSYIWLRFTRIYPLHVFTMFLMVCVSLLYTASVADPSRYFLHMLDLGAIPFHLTLTHSLFLQDATLNNPSWSIGVEWWVYMIFPFAAAYIAKHRKLAFTSIVVFVGIGYFLLAWYFQPLFWANRWAYLGISATVPFPMHTIDVITGAALLRCFLGFLLGMLVYEYLKSRPAPPKFPGFWLTVMVVALIVGWSKSLVADPVAVLAFSGIIYFAVCTRTRILNNVYCQYLGDVSYSVYLIHMPIMMLLITVGKSLGVSGEFDADIGFRFPIGYSWAGFSLFVLCLFPLSHLTYRYIELPIKNRLRNKFVISTR